MDVNVDVEADADADVDVFVLGAVCKTLPKPTVGVLAALNMSAGERKEGVPDKAEGVMSEFMVKGEDSVLTDRPG